MVQGLIASIAQLVEHALRKRTVVGSIPTGGSFGLVTTAYGQKVHTSNEGMPDAPL